MSFALGPLSACTGSASAPTAPTTVTPEFSAAAREIARAVRSSDSVLVLYASRDVREIAQAGIPRDASGLIGRNREWGEMYAARFQMGTGVALRMALTTIPGPDGERDARSALTGIEAGMTGMDAEGRLSARVPTAVSMGREAAPIDIASGAAFFLGDACLGLLALEAAPTRDAIAAPERRRALRAKLVQSVRWLATQAPLLMNGDRRAPNRLLFDARAYLACGSLADDPSVSAAAGAFVTAWRASVTPGGWFLEDDGWDTSYQAVSLDIGMDVAALLPDGATRSALLTDVARGGEWLAARVLPDGRVDSGGNARTCGGGESFLGTPKVLAVTSVVIGLAKVAVSSATTVKTAMLNASGRVSGWARRNPAADPCFSGIP